MESRARSKWRAAHRAAALRATALVEPNNSIQRDDSSVRPLPVYRQPGHSLMIGTPIFHSIFH